jgi:hypothetical protein
LSGCEKCSSRVMTRRCGAALALLIALATSTAPADARTACPSSRIVARSADAVVFTRVAKDDSGTVLYYGCLRRVKKTYRLNQVGEFGVNQVHRRTLRLAGRFVAYEQDWGSAAGSALNTISVRDLRTGKVVHQAYVSRRGADFGDALQASVLKRSGSVAWTVRTSFDYVNPTVEVRAMDAGTSSNEAGPIDDKPRLLDAGSEVDPRSLRLSADRRSVTWTNRAQPRSAPLS